MRHQQWEVQDFHVAFGVEFAEEPTLIEAEDARLRKTLADEEAQEYLDAALDGDLVGVADAIADALYIWLGTAEKHGIDITPVFEAVHRANMSKLDENGLPVPHPTIPGKVGKSDLFEPPEAEIEKILISQQEWG